MKLYVPIFVALTSLAGCSANKDAGEKGVEQLEGAWKVVSLTSGAEGDAPQEMIQDMIVLIKGDKWTAISGGQASEENFKLDTTKNPKTIDLTKTPIVGVVSDRKHPDRPEVNKEILPGIYDLDGDRLRICLANPGEKRPSQFPGKPQAGLVVLVLDRDKSPGPEKKIMAEIEKGGGYAHYGDGPAADQLYVSLEREKGDKELERISPSLKRLSKITGLHLYDAKVTDAGLANLKGINNIEHINLSRTTITDAGLVHLEGMTELRLLVVTGTKVTDAGITDLKKALPKLEVEKLTPIQEKANDEINKAGGILYTNVGATVRVDFRGAAISDAKLAELKPFLEVGKSSLNELNFLNSEISDKGLIHLKGLTGLKRMKLKAAKVTAEGAQALEQAIPGLKIEL